MDNVKANLVERLYKKELKITDSLNWNPGASKRKRIKRRLFNNFNKSCFYCGITVRTREQYDIVPDKSNLPDDYATVEHLYPIGDIRRLYPKQKDNLVLSCWKCNKEMNDKFQLENNYPFGAINLIAILKTKRIVFCQFDKRQEVSFIW